MTTVFTADEVEPGKWRMVRFKRNGAVEPVRYPLCRHKHTSPEEARECPAVAAQIPPAFENWRLRRKRATVR